MNVAKAMSAIEKFKKVEAAMRDIALAARKAIEQIDTATTDKRTQQENAALQAAREDCLRLQNAAREAIGDFFSRVEGRPVAAKDSANNG
jgi:hypothetical protein